MLGVSHFCFDFSPLAQVDPDLCTDVKKTFFESSSRSLGISRSFIFQVSHFEI